VYDLYLGLGLYHYWKSTKAGLLRWIGIFANDKEKGIAQLRVAADSALISSESARNSLIWIWLDADQLDSVTSGGTRMLKRYPAGVTPLWPLAEAYWRKEDYSASLDCYRRLRQRFSDAPGNYYNLIEIDYQILLCLDQLGLKDEAVATALAASGYIKSVPDDIRHRQRHKLAALARAARK